MDAGWGWGWEAQLGVQYDVLRGVFRRVVEE